MSKQPRRGPTATQARHDLAQLVITLTGINFDALLPDDIPDLQASTKFREFQTLIRTKARTIERQEGTSIYERDVRDSAEEILQAWHDTRSGVGKSLRAALFDQASTLAGEAVRSLYSGTDLVTVGTAVAALVVTSVRTIRRQRITAT